MTNASTPTRRGGARGTEFLSFRQALAALDAEAFANRIDRPLVALATINWGLTDAGEDRRGRRLQKVREGLSKWLQRRGLLFIAIWVREGGGGKASHHAHMVFNLPVAWRTQHHLNEIAEELRRLVVLHAGAALDNAVDVRLPKRPSILYLLKGASDSVAEKLGVLKLWRQPQGNVIGKRCGITENIGPLARGRKGERAVASNDRQETVLPVRSSFIVNTGAEHPSRPATQQRTGAQGYGRSADDL